MSNYHVISLYDKKETTCPKLLIESDGATYGVGILDTVKETFQLGLVVGKDRFDNGSPYANNGKTWIAANVGFTFTK